jgi:ERCC4-type nuclease
MSIHNKRNQITVTHEKLTSTYNDSGISFLYDNNKIHNLDLASGLIQLLLENNFTLESLLDTSSSELSKTLGIDQEVATLICKVAKNKKILNV